MSMQLYIYNGYKYVLEGWRGGYHGWCYAMLTGSDYTCTNIT
jgi:hypothetical protein